MKKLSGIILVAIAFAMVLPSCGKYEEGPALSLRSKTARLVNEWKVDQYFIAAVDVTAQYQLQNTDLVMNIKENGEIVNTYTNNTGDPVTYSSTWEFTSDKSGIIITTAGTSRTHDILRLKNDELWLKTTYSDQALSTIHEMHLITK